MYYLFLRGFMFEYTKDFVEILNPSVPITRDNGIKIEFDD